MQRWLGLLFCAALFGCATAGSAAPPEDSATFARSPGGTSEVSPEAVALLLGNRQPPARIIDVRDRAELSDELGHLAGIEWVPLGALAHASETWDPAAALVLVCRTGRRSARGVEQLEALGFRNVASMTGGMLRWNDLGLPVSREPVAAASSVPVRGSDPGVGDAPVQLDPMHVRWVRTAALLATGSESCIDGRDPHAVIGTPGGDAGELILALTAVEQASGRQLTTQQVAALLDAWVDGFGRLYIHTDLHALEALRAALVPDPRFHGHRAELATDARLEAFLRHPPRGLEDALLERLTEPQHVGCGHIRSMLIAPEAYQARSGLVVATLRAIFQRLWSKPEAIDWVVLSGEHHERAVVVVRLDEVIRPYTRLPAISPASQFGQAFVAHPQAAAYLREQHGYFLLDQLPWLREHVSQEVFSATIRKLAEVQLEATLFRLAKDLPRYDVRFQGQVPTEITATRADRSR
jgi:rhodanese-related sulfurtransferase